MHGQLTVTASADANTLVQQLLGPDVTFSNAQLVCPENGAGIFDGTSSNIGVPNGVLLTTGNVNVAIGPNAEPGEGVNAGLIFNQDPDLVNIAGLFGVRDNCVLEFDFQAQGDMLTFAYVFASEEYPEFFCDIFNDVFGFFLTGPNPTGPNYVAENIALIPGTNLPVSINNVGQNENGVGDCGGVNNSQYYVDNEGGATIEYDGFTTRFVVEIEVVPCADYTIKFAIGDVGDGLYD